MRQTAEKTFINSALTQSPVACMRVNPACGRGLNLRWRPLTFTLAPAVAVPSRVLIGSRPAPDPAKAAGMLKIIVGSGPFGPG